ncbi:hypothetical protein ACTHR6_24980 [Ralstonia holmesii]|uniref:hypothetical protein n=1 Tax=Ralstonia TaxID=48736 RepID=UPI000AA8AD3F|nr:hypothetical protein [Ralstonia pickettii]
MPVFIIRRDGKYLTAWNTWTADWMEATEYTDEQLAKAAAERQGGTVVVID